MLMSRSQEGITLQTLVITSVFLIIAVGASAVLLGINSGSSEDLEEAGKIDAGGGASCRPNEIFDLDYESKGLGGSQGQRGVVSSEIGCRPHCATWEFMTAGPNDDGEYELTKDWLRITQDNVGGPEGDDENVFSSRKGCFAPCYWEHTGATSSGRPKWIYAHTNSNHDTVAPMRTVDNRLLYYDDNRVPAAGEVRLGVIYRRGNRGSRDTNLYGTEYGPATPSRDGKRPIVFYDHASFGAVNFEGVVLPTMNPDLRATGTVARPNWRSTGIDPPLQDPPADRYRSTWEDEDWEVRADPESETCEIVNTARNDELVCTSARDNCAPA